jgi:hypothetical protein
MNDQGMSRARLGNRMQQNPRPKQGIDTPDDLASENPPSKGRTGAQGDPPIQFTQWRQW